MSVTLRNLVTDVDMHRMQATPCGYWDDMRLRFNVRNVEPMGSWWARLLCRLFGHQLPCCPSHTIWIDTGALLTYVCPRCGGMYK